MYHVYLKDTNKLLFKTPHTHLLVKYPTWMVDVIFYA
jgi:hypothetical protein